MTPREDKSRTPTPTRTEDEGEDDEGRGSDDPEADSPGAEWRRDGGGGPQRKKRTVILLVPVPGYPPYPLELEDTSDMNIKRSTQNQPHEKVLTVEEMLPLLHLPMEQAAAKAGCSSTTVKKWCRRMGMGRWPYRRIAAHARRAADASALASTVSESHVHPVVPKGERMHSGLNSRSPSELPLPPAPLPPPPPPPPAAPTPPPAPPMAHLPSATGWAPPFAFQYGPPHAAPPLPPPAPGPSIYVPVPYPVPVHSAPPPPLPRPPSVGAPYPAHAYPLPPVSTVLPPALPLPTAAPADTVTWRGVASGPPHSFEVAADELLAASRLISLSRLASA